MWAPTGAEYKNNLLPLRAHAWSVLLQLLSAPSNIGLFYIADDFEYFLENSISGTILSGTMGLRPLGIRLKY